MTSYKNHNKGKKMKKITLIILIVTVLVSGCAAINHGATQSVKVSPINTLLADTTECELVNEEGKWNVKAEQPAIIHRDGNAMKVDCKNATESGIAMVEPKFEGSYLSLDLLTDLCVISCIVDGGSNAFYSYPENIIVPMKSGLSITP